MCNFNVFVSISRYIAEGRGGRYGENKRKTSRSKDRIRVECKRAHDNKHSRSLTHSLPLLSRSSPRVSMQPAIHGRRERRRRAIKIKIRWLPELPTKRTRVLWAAVASAACLLLPGWGCWGRGAYVVLYKGFSRRSFIQPATASSWRVEAIKEAAGMTKQEPSYSSFSASSPRIFRRVLGAVVVARDLKFRG